MVDGTATALMATGMANVLAAISFESIFERLISTVILGAITAFVTIAVLKAQLKGIDRRVAQLEEADRARAAGVDAVALERSACELRAAKAFATRGEVGAVSIRNERGQQEVLDRLGQLQGQLADRLEAMDRKSEDRSVALHNRVNDIGEQVAELRGSRRVQP